MMGRREFLRRAGAALAALPLFKSLGFAAPVPRLKVGCRPMRLGDIKINPANNIRHPGYKSEFLDRLVASIRENGIVSPLHVNQSGEVICGFQRIEALKRLGAADDFSVPVVVLGDDDERLIELQRLSSNAVASYEPSPIPSRRPRHDRRR